MTRRTKRIAELIERELSAILSRDIEFPKGSFPNIIDIKVTADLRQATVWVGVVPASFRSRVLACLEKNAGEIQDQLNHRLEMKFVPRLTFKIDTSSDQVARVNELLGEIKDERSG